MFLRLSHLPLLALALLPACGSDDAGSASSDEASPDSGAAKPKPKKSVAGWTLGKPEEQGIDPKGIEKAMHYAFDDAKKYTQGVVVIRHGVLVAEKYADGRDAKAWASSWSVAKSFASTLIGILIDEGKIKDVHESIAKYYPEWKGTDKEDITIHDLLSMMSGIQWTEEYSETQISGGATSDVATMGIIKDPLRHVEELPVEFPPGEHWEYSSGDTMLLGSIIQKVTGKTPADVAREKIFDPLGMDQASWWLDGAGHTLTFCCLDTTTENFAKLGQLYLDGGEWEGKRVVSTSWTTTATHAQQKLASFYGYQWWIGPDPGGPNEKSVLPKDMFSCRGHDDQYIYVLPSLDLVVARNGRYNRMPPGNKARYLISGNKAVSKNGFVFTIPPQGLNEEGLGTIAAEEWTDEEFLAPIVAAIED